MRRIQRRFLRLAGLAVLLSCGLPSSVSAQLREFTGRVDAAMAGKLVVDNGGDKVAFAPAASVVVSGRKQSWQALAKGDWVTVSWRLSDRPRKAHRVVVLPPRTQ